ncbi:hypothetical protein [Candidatus Thiothrix anitrata]|uniref:Glycosyltransferase RgtA/B/C/D-like domain-containing protein n=1 Tax=Candidatus Thiothrix anitrata TaxID=2823902 RepID=A0ABX7X8X5_9GAMM|nr:hypothetical protein [Candidatus Thiothrix anitrata]QTR51695.1 hypothetical protein J8380_09255 [Candidatus Thiothrix anitrata]
MTIITLIIGFIVLLFSYTIGYPSLDDKSKIQFYADTPTYEKAYDEKNFHDYSSRLDFSYNYFGPLLILDITKKNRYIITFINIALFLYSVILINRAFKVKKLTLIILLLSSPILFSSLVFLNKEIFYLLSISMFFYAQSSRNIKIFFTFFIFSILIAFLARWQLSLFIIAIGITLNIKIFREHLIATIIMLSFVLSLFYNSLAENQFSSVFDVLDNTQDDHMGGGYFYLFHELSQKGLYFIIYPIKAIFLNFAMIKNISFILTLSDSFYNNTVITIHSMVNFLLWVYVIAYKTKKVNKDIIYILLLFSVIFCMTPIFAPRYFIIFHIVAAITISLKNNSSFNFIRLYDKPPIEAFRKK